MCFTMYTSLHGKIFVHFGAIFLVILSDATSAVCRTQLLVIMSLSTEFLLFHIHTFFFFYNWIVQTGFPLREIWVTWRKPAATELSYPTYGACWVFQCFHNPPNSGIDHRIFNMRTDVSACDCTWGYKDTARESALKVDSERKIPYYTCSNLDISLAAGFSK